MVLKKIRLPKVGAEEIMNDLGKIDDGLEFVDLTKNDLESQRHYALMIKRCDEIEKKIMYFCIINRNFNQILKEFNETSIKYESFKNVTNDIEEDQKRKNKDRSLYFDELENEIIEDERKLRELTNFVNDISDNLELLNEKWAVFDKVSQLVAVNPNLVGVIEA
jgi:hypothetical protein